MVGCQYRQTSINAGHPEHDNIQVVEHL